jgi:hypothetical protein
MAVSAARKKARSIAAAAAYQQIAENSPCPLTTADIPAYFATRHNTPTTYRIIWNHWGTTQPDDDNVVARIKSYKDGICELIGINDKNLRLRGVDFIRDKTTAKTLTLIIE